MAAPGLTAEPDAQDPGADFARLMSGAAAAAAPPAGEAPYGYTTDRATGETRPKRAAGRPKGPPPGADQLRAAAAAEGDQAPEDGKAGKRDTAPNEKGREPKGRGKPGPDPEPYTPGRIAKGMNRLYKRAGKIIRVFDPALGAAFIDSATKDEDDDLTVGDAYEELARTNPRIRALLNRLISGGAWGQLAIAHGPILLVVLTKPWILDRIPFPRLAEAIASMTEPEPGDPDAPAGGNPLAGLDLDPGDLQQLAGLAQGLMANIGKRAAQDPAAAAAAGKHRAAA